MIRQRATWMLLAAAALAIVVGVVFARTLSDPVDQLRGVALAVAEGDYGRTAGFERSDEIGDLARAFDHVSVRLGENEKVLLGQQAEIESFAQELQGRVDERTRELKDAQERLVRSGQLAAVAEVGAGLAHELNNPLAAILGLTQVLREKRKGSDDETALARIEEQAQRCRSVVAALLRLSSGEVDPLESGVVDLRLILRDVVELVQGPFRQRGVTVDLHESDAPLHVRIHPVYGTRILAQILGAFRAGLPEGARLELSASEIGDEVAIDLAPDRGLAVGNARDDWMASGMGLWVARHLLDQVGGRIEEPLAGQSRWRILLPGA
jgi:signal transduction histidine kinase